MIRFRESDPSHIWLRAAGYNGKKPRAKARIADFFNINDVLLSTYSWSGVEPSNGAGFGVICGQNAVFIEINAARVELQANPVFSSGENRLNTSFQGLFD